MPNLEKVIRLLLSSKNSGPHIRLAVSEMKKIITELAGKSGSADDLVPALQSLLPTDLKNLNQMNKNLEAMIAVISGESQYLAVTFCAAVQARLQQLKDEENIKLMMPPVLRQHTVVAISAKNIVTINISKLHADKYIQSIEDKHKKLFANIDKKNIALATKWLKDFQQDLQILKKEFASNKNPSLNILIHIDSHLKKLETIKKPSFIQRIINRLFPPKTILKTPAPMPLSVATTSELIKQGIAGKSSDNEMRSILDHFRSVDIIANKNEFIKCMKKFSEYLVKLGGKIAAQKVQGDSSRKIEEVRRNLGTDEDITAICKELQLINITPEDIKKIEAITEEYRPAKESWAAAFARFTVAVKTTYQEEQKNASLPELEILIENIFKELDKIKPTVVNGAASWSNDVDKNGSQREKVMDRLHSIDYLIKLCKEKDVAQDFKKPQQQLCNWIEDNKIIVTKKFMQPYLPFKREVPVANVDSSSVQSLNKFQAKSL